MSKKKRETVVTVKLKVAPINVFIEPHTETDNRKTEHSYTRNTPESAIISPRKGWAPTNDR